MAEIPQEFRDDESDKDDFESAAASYIEAREALITELMDLSLADFIRLLRKEDDPISQLAGSAGVYGRIAAVHFPGEKPAEAFNMLLTMGLRFVGDEDLDIEAPKAKDWMYREWDDTYGLTPLDSASESPQR